MLLWKPVPHPLQHAHLWKYFFPIFCGSPQMSTGLTSFTECHYHCYNKQSLQPWAKCNISKLKSPDQYFHYLHYKLSINGSSLGKAPSFSPCTSECCSGLTAGIAGCTAVWRVFSSGMARSLLVHSFGKWIGDKAREQPEVFSSFL